MCRIPTLHVRQPWTVVRAHRGSVRRGARRIPVRPIPPPSSASAQPPAVQRCRHQHTCASAINRAQPPPQPHTLRRRPGPPTRSSAIGIAHEPRDARKRTCCDTPPETRPPPSQGRGKEGFVARALYRPLPLRPSLYPVSCFLQPRATPNLSLSRRCLTITTLAVSHRHENAMERHAAPPHRLGCLTHSTLPCTPYISAAKSPPMSPPPMSPP